MPQGGRRCVQGASNPYTTTPIRDTVFLAQPVAEERPALPEEGGFVPHDPFAGLDEKEEK